MAELPALRKKPETAQQAAFRERRERLLKRLWWKVPLIILLMSFAVWWQLRQEKLAEPRSEAVTPEISKLARSLSGVWQGEVTYSWGAKYHEQFFFEPEPPRLFGTASFLGHKRGIEDGKVDGDGLSFGVRYQEVSGDSGSNRLNRYRGKLSGAEISFRMQDDKGGAPIEFVMRKQEASP